MAIMATTMVSHHRHYHAGAITVVAVTFILLLLPSLPVITIIIIINTIIITIFIITTIPIITTISFTVLTLHQKYKYVLTSNPNTYTLRNSKCKSLSTGKEAGTAEA